MPSSGYIGASKITSSRVPTPLELELMELIVNHRITLSGSTISFADIVGKLKVEFSPNLKEDIEQVEIDGLREQLRQIQGAKELVDIEIQQLTGELNVLADQLRAKGVIPYQDAEFRKISIRRERLYAKEGSLYELINEIEDTLNAGDPYVNVSTCVLGEFVPGTDPQVLLFYNNIDGRSIHNRFDKLLGTFVHEMIHAWFYFISHEQPRTVKVVDEPMVEFSTLFFLNDLVIETAKSSHKLSREIEAVLKERIESVQNKQYQLGSTAAYGYGYFLYENLGKDSKRWIEEYALKSSTISICNIDVETFQTSFATCYPFNEESKLKDVLERIIFNTTASVSTHATASTTVAHKKTKSDPICKWRIASVATVIELVSLLPKTRMSREDFRFHMSPFYKGAYFRTPYQLALQLGLYYEDDVEYIPRFDHNITEAEATAYMHKWMERYYVPNPFTKQGFIGVVPSINLLNGLLDFLKKNPHTFNLEAVGAALFGGVMGNVGSVKYVLNEYSKIIEVDNFNNMTLRPHSVGPIEVYNHRDDKKAFFHHFD